MCERTTLSFRGRQVEDRGAAMQAEYEVLLEASERHQAAALALQRDCDQVRIVLGM
jgi:hypothetical protein